MQPAQGLRHVDQWEAEDEAARDDGLAQILEAPEGGVERARVVRHLPVGVGVDELAIVEVCDDEAARGVDLAI